MRMAKLKHFDCFSGIGGFTEATNGLPIETVGFSEIDEFCCKYLGKYYPQIPNYGDIRSIERIDSDIVTAGFPCQDISPASSTRTGLDGDRSGLFYKFLEVVCRSRPKFVVLENSAALLTHRSGADMAAILWQISCIGYDALWSIVSACSVGAPHMRRRLFIVAYPNSFNVQRLAFQQKFHESLQKIDDRSSPRVWASEPPDPSLADGVKNRRSVIRAIGNSVVPAAATVPLKICCAMSEALNA